MCSAFNAVHMTDLERLDGTGRQLGAMLAAQKLQQDGDALVGGLRIARLALINDGAYQTALDCGA